MAAIRHSLHKDVFQPNDERLIGVVCVAKASKKKKTSFLCAAVTLEKPIQAFLYHVKKAEKDTYKKRSQWALRELKIVDGKSTAKETAELDLHFDKCYKWIASSVPERNGFISCLWKLCHRYLPRQKPAFNNIPESLLEECIQINENAIPSVVAGEDGIVESEDYEALSAREESDLVKLMEQTQCAISNAEMFTEQLSRDLSVLDGTNVHTIMASEQGVESLMQLLQIATDEATMIEEKLDSYDELLKNVRDNILMMEEKDSLIHVQNTNNLKLMEELETVIEQLDLPHKHQVSLIDGDLVNASSISDCVAAAKALHEAMNAQIHPSLMKMAAVQQQHKLFEKLKTKFSQRLSRHLNNLFIHLGLDTGETLGLHSTELTLPKHNSCHRELRSYAELMAWLKVADQSSYNQLAKTYTLSLKKLYEREIKDFFDSARAMMSRGVADKRNRASGSSQDLSTKSSIKGRPSLLGSDSDHFVSELDINDKQKFDKLLERMLSELEPVCLSEQRFCLEFFSLGCDMSSSMMVSSVPGHSSSPFSKSNSEEHIAMAMKKVNEKEVSDGLRKMMGELFSALEPELLKFLDHFDKVDGFYSMYSLVRLSQHVMSAQDTGSFLSMTFANALVQVKRNFDRFMDMQILSVEEAKVAKKTKCGILPFVSNFENFATQAEGIFKSSDRRNNLDKRYKALIRAIFDSITRIAGEHLKTPREVIMMENFHYLVALLSKLKVSSLDAEKKEAKQKYTESLQAYVTLYFGRPLEKLNTFFEGVQSKVAQGVKEDEIGYQLVFSKQELRKVIKEYPGKEVKKGLENLYRKVEKHLSDQGNLIQVVWRSMLEEFVTQYKYIEGLIERCYPGSMISLEFTIDDILEFFSDIARSH